MCRKRGCVKLKENFNSNKIVKKIKITPATYHHSSTFSVHFVLTWQGRVDVRGSKIAPCLEQSC